MIYIWNEEKQEYINECPIEKIKEEERANIGFSLENLFDGWTEKEIENFYSNNTTA